MNSNKLKESYKYCRDLTVKSDSNFALGFTFLPKAKRDAIYAVYAFNRCADDFADEIEFKETGSEWLDKWERMLEECYRGTPDHPVMAAFSHAVNKYKIPIKPFKDALEGFRMDFVKNRYNNFDELKIYCDRVAGTISVMSLHIFGFSDPKALEYGDYLSYALQLTNIIRDVGKDIKKDRIYLPLNEMEKFNYSEKELLLYTDNDNFQKLMQFQIERAERYFEKANPLMELVDEDSRYTCLMIGSVYAKILEKIKKNGIQVLKKDIKLTTIEKSKLALEKKSNYKFI